MIPQDDCLINYASATAAARADGGIVIPGAPADANVDRMGKRDADDGVVITPDPSGIVIKTRLTKEEQNRFSFDDDHADADGPYVPQSLSNIYAANEAGNDDAKVFLNLCTHPLIAPPGQRKGLDETGKEVDGWRLPMSMGDPRPCYDKSGRAAIVADCVLNPGVVRDMNTDHNHFQFVCDLVVRCASRKFGQAVFNGRALDRRFKLPKMRYAGHVDEATGLPILPDGAGPLGTTNGAATQKAAVAKQRVKGHGGKSPIIEEVENSGPKPVVKEAEPSEKRVSASTEKDNSTGLKSLKGGRAEPKKGTAEPESRIELFIFHGDRRRMPLSDFLSFVADQDGIAPPGQPSGTLREQIQSPKLKAGDGNGILHESQRLVAPVALDVISLGRASEFPWRNRSGGNEDTASDGIDCWGIAAKCFVGSNTQASDQAAPTAELSAFRLVLRTGARETECILPFAVDTRRASTAYDPKARVIEVRMPLLPVSIGDGPDPGTRPWELQNALGKSNGRVSSKSEIDFITPCEKKRADESSEDMFDSYFAVAEVDEVVNDDDDAQPLPEDAFHSRDVLSQHLLQRQAEERKERTAKNAQGRDEADVEYINANDFRPKPDKDGPEESVESSTFQEVRRVIEGSLRNHGPVASSDLVLGLV